jgi:hypothetical protein
LRHRPAAEQAQLLRHRRIKEKDRIHAT